MNCNSLDVVHQSMLQSCTIYLYFWKIYACLNAILRAFEMFLLLEFFLFLFQFHILYLLVFKQREKSSSLYLSLYLYLQVSVGFKLPLPEMGTRNPFCSSCCTCEHCYCTTIGYSMANQLLLQTHNRFYFVFLEVFIE